MKTGVILHVPLELLASDPDNFFEVEGSEEIEAKNRELMDSIAADGLLHPVLIRPDLSQEGHYIIVSGHRRVMAYSRLKDETGDTTKYGRVPCVMRNIRDELKARLMMLEANTTARQSSAWEQKEAVRLYGEILDAMAEAGEPMEGRRRDNIARSLGISKTQVGQYEHIEKNLGPEYMDELKENHIGVSVADKIASLPKEEQSKMHAEKGAEVKLADLKKPEPAQKSVRKPEQTSEPPSRKDEWQDDSDYETIDEDMRLALIDKLHAGKLTPCETCKLATCCKHCCRVCNNPCTCKQDPCRMEDMMHDKGNEPEAEPQSGEQDREQVEEQVEEQVQDAEPPAEQNVDMRALYRELFPKVMEKLDTACETEEQLAVCAIQDGDEAEACEHAMRASILTGIIEKANISSLFPDNVNNVIRYAWVEMNKAKRGAKHE